MFKFFHSKKKDEKIEALEQHVKYLNSVATNRAKEQVELMGEKCDLEIEIDELQNLVSVLKKKNTELSDELKAISQQKESPSVKLVFDPKNYEIVTPVIVTDDDSFESLFTIRAIDDSQSTNINAIRLSMINLAREALEQICDDFTGDLT